MPIGGWLPYEPTSSGSSSQASVTEHSAIGWRSGNLGARVKLGFSEKRIPAWPCGTLGWKASLTGAITGKVLGISR